MNFFFTFHQSPGCHLETTQTWYALHLSLGPEELSFRPQPCQLVDADGEAGTFVSVLADLCARVPGLAVPLTGMGHILEMAWLWAPLVFSVGELRQPTTP